MLTMEADAKIQTHGEFMPTATLFDQIDHDSVSEAVIAQIEDVIITGVLKSGQKLPSERELAQQTGVSRPKIRVAIQTLEDRGLLAVKHGEGTFVASLTGTALSSAMIDLFSRHPEAFGDYLEFRREVEGFAAFTAAQRATSEDLAIIQQILDEMADATVAFDPAREMKLDVQFHGAVVDATHNAMLVHTMASIYELLARGVFLGRNMEYLDTTRREVLLEQHQAIGLAIFSRDAHAAASAAEEHINFVEFSYREANSLERRTDMARKRRSLFTNQQQPTSRQRPSS